MKKLLPAVMLSACLVAMLPVMAATLSDKATDNIAMHSQQTCAVQVQKSKKKPKSASYCHDWAKCYASEVQKTTTLEEMKAADAEMKAKGHANKLFNKKMARASALCAQQVGKAGK